MDQKAELVHRGVTILQPESVYIAPDIDPSRISREGVVLHPGTRLRGAQTLIGPNCVLGEEAPVTLDDCALGKRVHLKGGFATNSALLDDVTIGSGAQIREGCLLEEFVTLGHNVGLKQTILMPYATLGSQINFCDALLAGGTGPRDHSEVGSGFVHFNFSPGGTKATASLFGDVPRGVMLQERRIFLGGQSGAVGPLRVGFGTVVGAGSILRHDLGDDRFVLTGAHEAVLRQNRAAGQVTTPRLARIVGHNLDYIANLRALSLWYAQVRWAYCGRFRLGAVLNQVAQGVLSTAVAERCRRLRDYIAALVPTDAAQRQLVANTDALIEAVSTVELPLDEGFVATIDEHAFDRAAAYLETLAALDAATIALGSAWLRAVVDTVGQAGAATVPLLGLTAWQA